MTENAPPQSAFQPSPAEAPRDEQARRLGDLLVSEGVLTHSQLDELLVRQSSLDEQVHTSLLARFWREHYPEDALPEDWVVSFEGVTKRFGHYTAVRDLNFKIHDIPGHGEFISLLGPSGCGKSTILNMIAGFYPASEGRILIDGVPVTGPGSDRGMVFQSYSSFPNLKVWQNVAFGMMLKELNKPGNLVIGLLDRIIGIRGARRRAPNRRAVRRAYPVGRPTRAAPGRER